MQRLTNTASSRDWLEASKDMKISAYVDPRWVPVGEAERPFTEGDFQHKPRKAGRKSKPERETS